MGSVPAISVYRTGHWSKPGLLIEGPNSCEPLFAWCEAEKLHLLLTQASNRTVHLVYDPRELHWARGAVPLLTPSAYDTIRQVGKAVHLVCSDGGYVNYLRFDGISWSAPVRIEASKHASNTGATARLAVDRDDVAHVAWWAADGARGAHGYATIRGERVIEAGTLRFDDCAICGEEFDLGIDPQGHLLLAYKPEIANANPNALKLQLRRLEGKRWTIPQSIDVPGDILFGHIRVVWYERRTMVTWLSRETTAVGAGVLRQGVRRLSITEGKTWSTPRVFALAAGPLRGLGQVPVGPISLGLTVDKRGDVHATWGSPEALHCVVARLGPFGRPPE